MKNSYLVFAFLLLFLATSSSAQTIPVGTPVLEEVLRRRQIAGEGDSLPSFAVRPLSFPVAAYDTLLASLAPHRRRLAPVTFAGGRGVARLLPVTLTQQYNSHHPYGWNDGSMIPARGYQNQLSMGVAARLGFVSVQLQPELVVAGNRNFSTFPSSHTDEMWYSYYTQVQNRIDHPEKFGSGSYSRLFPGQSSVRLHVKKLSAGLSTENLWWGPGIRNSLLMSNTAPGFPHLTFNTSAPVLSAVGAFEWQVVSGLLANSGLLPDDTSRRYTGVPLYAPKQEEERYLNGMILTWQPKWTKGLYLGFSRVLYLYRSDIQGIGGYLPVVAKFFKDNAANEDDLKRDQLLSVFLRLVLPRDRAEVYAEYGRNDHSANSRDLLLEPEHARGYILGGRKLFPAGKGKDLELFIELTQLQNPPTARFRAVPTWYVHHQVRHGYTHRGQVLGAGIGPGSNSQTIGLSWLHGLDSWNFSLERVVRNNDLYQYAVVPDLSYDGHWVDVSANARKNWVRQNLVYSANLSLVRSYNYQWRNNHSPADGKRDVNNLHARFSVSYLF
ncbi:capsule assembly Wzi family protein [Paraflavisolibacter sp. H34]|uniref:capsule assembly Wzi family protein n=1 Tax=Huijunlia imazamoxiresistens TaxID=3127457 RepID=UPI003019202F